MTGALPRACLQQRAIHLPSFEQGAPCRISARDVADVLRCSGLLSSWEEELRASQACVREHLPAQEGCLLDSFVWRHEKQF